MKENNKTQESLSKVVSTGKWEVMKNNRKDVNYAR